MKLFTVEEAAGILGISADQVNALRERNKLPGVRVGSLWKFKEAEVQRYAADRGDDDSSLDLSDDAPSEGKSDVVLLSEVELGGSMPGSSSTIIGKSRKAAPPAKSDDLPSLDDVSDDFALVDMTIDESRTGSGSSIPLDLGSSASGSSVLQPGSSSSLRESGSELRLGSDILRSSSDSLNVEEEGIALTGGKGSSLDLSGSGFEDDDLVLGTGSDVSINPGESGISLSNPSDSGLSLESLELGSDDSGLTELRAEDTFDLTPHVDMGDDESSGSQVIALDSEASFDDSAATMLGEDFGSPMLEEEPQAHGMMPPVMVAPQMGMAGPQMGMGGPQMGAMPGMAAPTVQAGYSMLQVLSLMTCILVLGLTGWMLFDVTRNIWSWGEPYKINSWLMDTILGLLGRPPA